MGLNTKINIVLTTINPISKSPFTSIKESTGLCQKLNLEFDSLPILCRQVNHLLTTTLTDLMKFVKQEPTNLSTAALSSTTISHRTRDD